MIIFHEDLPQEAKHIALSLQEVYGFNCEIEQKRFDGVFIPIPEFQGYDASAESLYEVIPKDKKSMIITPRDLYLEANYQEDDWIFAYCVDVFNVLSTARLKGKEAKPRDDLEINVEEYLDRLACVAIHEIGHEVVKGDHLKPAYWVNADTGYMQEQGPHCDDNRCVMYESNDILSPDKSEGFMLLGGRKKFDTGLADLMERLYTNWFCKRCRDSINVDNSYSL